MTPKQMKRLTPKQRRRLIEQTENRKSGQASSYLRKDLVKTIRINKEVLKALEGAGWTVQRLLDDAVKRRVRIKTTIEVK